MRRWAGVAVATAFLATGCSSGPKVHLADLHPQITDAHLVTSQNQLAHNVGQVIDAVNGRPVRSFTLAPTTDRHTQYLIGRFSIAADPRDAGAQLSLILIDAADHTVLTAWPVPQSGVDIGWDGSYNGVAKKYQWLADMADRPIGNGDLTSDNVTASWEAGPARTITFYALVPKDANPLTGPHPTDLLAAVIEVGPNRHPWGAVRLPVTIS